MKTWRGGGGGGVGGTLVVASRTDLRSGDINVSCFVRLCYAVHFRGQLLFLGAGGGSRGTDVRGRNSPRPRLWRSGFPA